jgi:hypothetical protein
MAYTTIDDPSQYFTTVLSTSTGSALTIDTGFKPDWLWTKARNFARSYELHDTTRGDNKRIKSDATTAEESYSNYLAFTSTGATFGTNHNLGYHTEGATTGVSWAWKANGGTTSSNNDGSYTSTVQANTTAGFSIVKYGDASSFSASTPATVGHGLGKAPKWIIIKNLDGTRSWGVHHAGLTSAGKIIYLDLTNAEADSSGFMNSTAPSSTVFTVNTLNVANGNNLEYIAYCFAEIQGYSKFGSYTGNGNADGPFIYTGFKPAWLMFKKTSGTDGWGIFDNKRNTQTGNPRDIYLQPNNNNADSSESDSVDFLSNGFKWRISSGFRNESGQTYIYMAFAEHPFVSSEGVPITAV